VSSALAAARPDLRSNHSRRLRGTYVGHDRKCDASAPWGDFGAAFDSGIRSFGAGRLGRWRGARCCGWSRGAGGGARALRASPGRGPGWPHRFTMVTAPQVIIRTIRGNAAPRGAKRTLTEPRLQKAGL